jgi:hypothetical protein
MAGMQLWNGRSQKMGKRASACQTLEAAQSLSAEILLILAKMHRFGCFSLVHLL